MVRTFIIKISLVLIGTVTQAIGGEVAGRLDIIDQLQIRVTTGSLQELKDLCEKVKTMERVEDASVETSV